ATREVNQMGLTRAAKTARIASGRHRLALEQRRDKEKAVWRVNITCDGSALLVLKEPEEWDPDLGNEGGGEYTLSGQIAVDQPVVLIRRRFMRRVAEGHSMAPQGPTNGLLLWIQQSNVGKGMPPR